MGRDVDGDQALAVGERVEPLESRRAPAEAARGEAGIAAPAAARPGGEVVDGRIRSRAQVRLTPREASKSRRSER